MRFFGWHESDAFYYIAMEWIELGNLRVHLRDVRTESDKKAVTRQILQGLEIMHAEGITHRDLKPEVGFKFPHICLLRLVSKPEG